ncbi:hypothetical protein HGRIS_013322 [Hohenbuehelia grisea]|uniref:F-box domain-containing protein n=1 Tax=Hohenbuehelia grisea TaxID=104357 RepID=A0ABR3IVD8_9AGAR
MAAVSPTTSSYVCDTLPAPRLASDADEIPITTDTLTNFAVGSLDTDAILRDSDDAAKVEDSGTPPPQPPPRKLCFRHQRMADEGTYLKLQKELDRLPTKEREAVSQIWSNFSSSSHPRRALILHGLLTMCCFSQLSLLTDQLSQLIRIDPFSVLPREVSLKILGHLDATSLCRAAQVSRTWKALADDNILWRGICEQHIGQKCRNCGWGLPILEKKRKFRMLSESPCPSSSHAAPQSPAAVPQPQEEPDDAERPRQRRRINSHPHPVEASSSSSQSVSSLLAGDATAPSTGSVMRPWKDVYSERLTIERNWRRGRCSVRTLQGHQDGVMCLQFSETLSHPAFPILITGSYDRTARVWNLETGAELHCLKGHTRAVRALQFDEVKLITGSMDHTIRVWDWRRGRCIRTLTGHTEGVVCLNFDSNVLASGSVDATIRVWNLRTGGAFSLRGHRDWVNAVQLWDSNSSPTVASTSASATLDFAPAGCSTAPEIDVGKMLFSASDDGTIKLWDLSSRSCVRQFTGHVGQVQSMKLLFLDDECGEDGASQDGSGLTSAQGPVEVSTSGVAMVRTPYSGLVPLQAAQSAAHQADAIASSNQSSPASASQPLPSQPKPILISGSLDNTVKYWDIDTGKATQTLFGHIEGVWAVASDQLRLVSGSHDRTIKVWSREEDRCTATLVGHRGAVTCLGLGEDKIVSGSDDGDIRVWSFAG